VVNTGARESAFDKEHKEGEVDLDVEKSEPKEQINRNLFD